jgi:hypothetical protein
MAATHPATAGPPSAIAATTGAIATAWCVPKGSLIGNADVTTVNDVQKRIPRAISNSVGVRDPDDVASDRVRAILGSAGNTKVATTSASALRVTTPAI